MYDVAALGELMVDFIPEDELQSKNPIYGQYVGGASANVLASVTRLGGNGAFLGKVGNDPFGVFLKRTMKKIGVDMSGLKFTNEAHTPIAFVHLDQRGDRQFTFYGSPGADQMLAKEDLEYELIENSRVFYFGSLPFAGKRPAEAVKSALQFAVSRNKIIAYDPNWRPALWHSEQKAREGMEYALQYVDVIKLTEEELTFLTGESDLAKGTSLLLERGISIIFVTQGANGCFFRCKSGMGHCSTYDTAVVDTTGSGDTFVGASLYRLTRPGVGISSMDVAQLRDIADFANAAGALCASGKGAQFGSPSLDEIEACRKTIPHLDLA